MERNQPPHLAHHRPVHLRVPAGDAARQPRRPCRGLVPDRVCRAHALCSGARLVGPTAGLDQVAGLGLTVSCAGLARWIRTSPEPLRTCRTRVSSPCPGPSDRCSLLVTTPDPVMMSNRAAVPSAIPTATSPL